MQNHTGIELEKENILVRNHSTEPTGTSSSKETEELVFKYKRAKQLNQFFEQKYQGA